MSPSLRCSAFIALLFSRVILSAMEIKTESFDRDPGWDGLNNHVTPKKIPIVTQDFGYKTSNVAGKEKGEIGGQIWRSSAQNNGVKSTGNREAPKRISVEPNEGPVLVPHKIFDWKVVYDPEGNNGHGLLEATLGSESTKLPLKKGDKSTGAILNHFDLFTTKIGGSYVRIYLDDITYTTER